MRLTLFFPSTCLLLGLACSGERDAPDVVPRPAPAGQIGSGTNTGGDGEGGNPDGGNGTGANVPITIGGGGQGGDFTTSTVVGGSTSDGGSTSLGGSDNVGGGGV